MATPQTLSPHDRNLIRKLVKAYLNNRSLVETSLTQLSSRLLKNGQRG
jgi:hypothetical protein